MKFVYLKEVASAATQCCGIWLQYKDKIIGIFPNWWWDNKSKKHSSKKRNFVLGLKLQAYNHHGGTYTLLGLRTKWFRLSYRKAFCTEFSEGLEPGWHFYNKRKRT